MPTDHAAVQAARRKGGSLYSLIIHKEPVGANWARLPRSLPDFGPSVCRSADAKTRAAPRTLRCGSLVIPRRKTFQAWTLLPEDPRHFGADRQPRPEPKPAQPTSPRLGRAALRPGDPSLASFRQNLRTDPADKLSTTCQQAIGRLSTSGQSTVNEAAMSRPSARGQSVNKLSVPCPKSVNKLLARRRSIVGNYSTATSYLQRSDLPLPLVFHRSRRFPAVFPAVRRGIGTPSATTRRKP